MPLQSFSYTSSGLELLSTWEYAVLAILATIAFVLSLNLRKRARKWAGQRVAEASFTSRFTIAFLSVFGRYAPHWITSSVVAICLYQITLGITPLPFITQAALGVPFYFLLLTLVYLFLAPKHPKRTITIRTIVFGVINFV